MICTKEERRQQIEEGAFRRIDAGSPKKDQKYTEKLIDALCQIPDDVLEPILDQCYFLAIGRNVGGFYLHPQRLTAKKQGEHPCRAPIVLNAGWKISDFGSQAAHEIAHIHLRHDEGPVFEEDRERQEEEAADLVRGWGISGAGARSPKRPWFVNRVRTVLSWVPTSSRKKRD